MYPLRKNLPQCLDGVDLLILDDVGNGAVPPESGGFFYDIMNRRHEKGLSTIIATNKAVTSWGTALGDSTSVRAGLDRFFGIRVSTEILRQKRTIEAL